MPSPDLATALALCAAFLFGLALVITQLGLSHLPPRLGAQVSLVTSTAMFWLLSPLLVDWHGWNARAALLFAMVGLLFPASVTLLTYESNRRMGPNVAGALGNLTPLFAVLLAIAALGEAPRPAQAIGIAAIILGVGAFSLDRRWLDQPWPAWALVFPLAAAAVRGIVQPVTKLGLVQWSDPFAAALIGYTVSGAVIFAVNARRGGIARRELNRCGIAWFALIGLCNGAAVLMLYAALAHGSVTLVSPLVATYPLVTLCLSAILLRNASVGLRQFGGVLLTVAGAVIMVASR